MADHERIYWRWRVLEKTRTGRDTWRLLRWTMSDERAAEWAEQNQKEVRKEPGSGETRLVSDEPYRGWG